MADVPPATQATLAHPLTIHRPQPVHVAIPHFLDTISYTASMRPIVRRQYWNYYYYLVPIASPESGGVIYEERVIRRLERFHFSGGPICEGFPELTRTGGRIHGDEEPLA